MSTEKNTPADDTAGDAVDETQPIAPVDETQPIAPVDETRPLPEVDADPVDETEQIAPVAGTEPLPAVESSPGAWAETTVDETRPLAVATPTVDEPPFEAEPTRAPDPFDVFTPAPAQAEGWQAASEPVLVVDPPAADTEPGQRRLRVGTVVWGLVLAACGLGVIAWASGARIDFQLALIVLLAAAGVALLVGSIVSGARHARR